MREPRHATQGARPDPSPLMLSWRRRDTPLPPPLSARRWGVVSTTGGAEAVIVASRHARRAARRRGRVG